MKRKAPTRQEQPQIAKQSSPFFAPDRTPAFFRTDGADAFFQPPGQRHSTQGQSGASSGGSSKGQTAGANASSSATPAPYYISFTHVAPPAQPDHSQANPGPPGKAANRAGFTRISHRPSLSIKWGQTVPNSRGQIGLFVRSANVGFDVHTLTVAISSNYARGSCPYRVTYAHEYRHARNFLRIFRSHRPTMVQRAQGLPLPTVHAPRYVDPAQLGTVQDQIGAPLAQAIRDVQTHITTDMRADRDGMDSPSSYAREYAQCPRSDW